MLGHAAVDSAWAFGCCCAVLAGAMTGRTESPRLVVVAAAPSAAFVAGELEWLHGWREQNGALLPTGGKAA
eukprot:6186993-Pleurochrysis_carterae.AAC.2